MKVIFLDFDGVLNTPAIWSNWPSVTAIDPVLVQRVSALADETSAVVVISSTWRCSHTKSELQGFLRHHGFRNVDRIIDFTPNFPWPAVREEEILAWLKVHPDVTEWVILDDDTAGDHQWEQVIANMVFINQNVGLTEADCVEAVAILTQATVPSPSTAPAQLGVS